MPHCMENGHRRRKRANVLGWFIGYLEKDGNTYYFAVNIQNEQDADGTAATALAFEVLEALGLWN